MQDFVPVIWCGILLFHAKNRWEKVSEKGKKLCDIEEYRKLSHVLK